MKKKAIFFDRDGVLIKAPIDKEKKPKSIINVEQIELCDENLINNLSWVKSTIKHEIIHAIENISIPNNNDELYLMPQQSRSDLFRGDWVENQEPLEVQKLRKQLEDKYYYYIVDISFMVFYFESYYENCSTYHTTKDLYSKTRASIIRPMPCQKRHQCCHTNGDSPPAEHGKPVVPQIAKQPAHPQHCADKGHDEPNRNVAQRACVQHVAVLVQIIGKGPGHCRHGQEEGKFRSRPPPGTQPKRPHNRRPRP
jgi:hypothetical protein